MEGVLAFHTCCDRGVVAKGKALPFSLNQRHRSRRTRGRARYDLYLSDGAGIAAATPGQASHAMVIWVREVTRRLHARGLQRRKCSPWKRAAFAPAKWLISSTQERIMLVMFGWCRVSIGDCHENTERSMESRGKPCWLSCHELGLQSVQVEKEIGWP